METWKDYELTLTVGKTLALEAKARTAQIPELDVIGNPVVCLTALRRPGIVVELFQSFAGQPLPVDEMTGADFTQIRETMERLILDFFQTDPKMHALLVRIMELEQEARLAVNEAAIKAELNHIETIRNPPIKPPGGTSSGIALVEQDLLPGPSPSPNSPEQLKSPSDPDGITQPA